MVVPARREGEKPRLQIIWAVWCLREEDGGLCLALHVGLSAGFGPMRLRAALRANQLSLSRATMGMRATWTGRWANDFVALTSGCGCGGVTAVGGACAAARAGDRTAADRRSKSGATAYRGGRRRQRRGRQPLRWVWVQVRRPPTPDERHSRVLRAVREPAGHDAIPAAPSGGCRACAPRSGRAQAAAAETAAGVRDDRQPPRRAGGAQRAHARVGGA